jgi:hypothetical protein
MRQASLAVRTIESTSIITNLTALCKCPPPIVGSRGLLMSSLGNWCLHIFSGSPLPRAAGERGWAWPDESVLTREIEQRNVSANDSGTPRPVSGRGDGGEGLRTGTYSSELTASLASGPLIPSPSPPQSRGRREPEFCCSMHRLKSTQIAHSPTDSSDHPRPLSPKQVWGRLEPVRCVDTNARRECVVSLGDDALAFTHDDANLGSQTGFSQFSILLNPRLLLVADLFGLQPDHAHRTLGAGGDEAVLDDAFHAAQPRSRTRPGCQRSARKCSRGTGTAGRM